MGSRGSVAKGTEKHSSSPFPTRAVPWAVDGRAGGAVTSENAQNVHVGATRAWSQRVSCQQVSVQHVVGDPCGVRGGRQRQS